MKTTKHTLIVKLIIGISMLCLLTVEAFPVLVGNHLEYAYEATSSSANSSRGHTLTTFNPRVQKDVATAAVYLLTAKARFDEVLEMVEAHCMEIDAKNVGVAPWCGPKTPSLENVCDYLECAIENIQEARKIYENLKNYTTGIPYNKTFIKRLKEFPYNDFFESYVEYSTELDVATCNAVRNLLSSNQEYNLEGDEGGDVTKIYQTFSDRLWDLETRMLRVSERIGCPGVLVSIPANKVDRIIHELWNINYLFSWIHMFGQHVAEVFFNIKSNWN
ncbi:MAG: hypothetical protein GY757_53570 [bacterium]|nr:hypothetical protein [bacterium]